MSLILWIIFGAIVGWVASLIMGTDAQQGMIMNIVFGILGALLGGWLFSLFGYGGTSGFNLYSFVVALIGAVILIGIARAMHVGTARLR